jgi:hypothetical protein
MLVLRVIATLLVVYPATQLLRPVTVAIMVAPVKFFGT